MVLKMLHEKRIVENPMKARSFNDILKNLKNYAYFLMKFAQFAFKVRGFLMFYSEVSTNMKLLR